MQPHRRSLRAQIRGRRLEGDIHGHRQRKGDALAAEYGSNVIFEEGDTRSRMDIKRAVASATEHFGGIDAVFANAGIHRSNTLLDISDEELDMILQINIIGTVNTLQEAVPPLSHAEAAP